MVGASWSWQLHWCTTSTRDDTLTHWTPSSLTMSDLFNSGNYCETCCSSKIFEVLWLFGWFSALFSGHNPVHLLWRHSRCSWSFYVVLGLILTMSDLFHSRNSALAARRKFSRFSDHFRWFSALFSGHNPVHLLWRHSRCSWLFYVVLGLILTMSDLFHSTLRNLLSSKIFEVFGSFSMIFGLIFRP